MKTSSFLAMTFLSLAIMQALTFSTAEAQQRGRTQQSGTAEARLYRWVDENGVVRFSDSLPPEVIEQQRTEYSRRSGLAVREVETALTEEERAAAMAAMRQEERDRILAQEAQQEALNRARVMLETYPDPSYIEQDFERREGILDGRIVSRRAAIAEQNIVMQQALAIAAEADLMGREPSDSIQNRIQESWTTRLQRQQDIALLEEQRQELLAMRDRLLEEWETSKQLLNNHGVEGEAEASSTPQP